MASHDQLPIVDSRPPRQRLAHVPPLSILYILLLTAVTAVVFSSPQFQALKESRTSMPLEIVFTLVVRCLYAAMLTGLLLMGWHAARRTLWVLEPGEWLVGAAATSYLVWTLGEAILPYFVDRSSDVWRYTFS